MNPQSPIRLIVGLGNPGQEYAETRHNAGVWFIEQLLRKYSAQSPLSEESKFKGLHGQILVGSSMVRLLVPLTYMNLSGQSVAAIANFYKIDIESILVAHDELDIDPGTARLKMGGGHGGHNGLRDIIKCMGNQKNFGRLRIGIGHPGNAKQVSNFVLKKTPEKEKTLIEDTIHEVIRHSEEIVKGEWQIAMNAIHSFNAAEQQL